jgi:hypothetical protein
LRCTYIVTPFAQGLIIGVIVNAIVFAVAIIIASRPRARGERYWP